MSENGNDNANDNNNADNIIFTIKNTKFYVLVAILSTRHYQKLSKLFNKGFERSVYWNKYITKSKIKKTKNEYRYFLESKFVEVNRLFVLVYSNQDANFKRFKTRRYYLPKCIIKNCNIIVNRKNFYDQAFDSDIKRY